MAYYKHADDEHKTYLNTFIDAAAKLKAKESLDAVPALPSLLLGWPTPSASISHVLWQENSLNANFTGSVRNGL